tara:strand:- start:8684 stop:9346 length:663 start_codon:yes stop_codon:yes gene_type:complete
MAIKTFTEPARGRKKCPADGCPHYVASVTKKCPCGHEFVRGTKPKPPTKVAAKLATAAGTTQGKTSKSDRPLPSSTPPPPKLWPRDRADAGMMRTATPAGACPAKLKGTDEADVYEWIVKVLKAKEDHRTEFMPSAVKYFVREFYDILCQKNDDYKIVCGHIDSWWAKARAGGTVIADDDETDDEDVDDEDDNVVVHHFENDDSNDDDTQEDDDEFEWED